MKTKVQKCADAFMVHENSNNHYTAEKINDSEEETDKKEESDSREGITLKKRRARNPFETFLLNEKTIDYLKEVLEKTEEENVNTP